MDAIWFLLGQNSENGSPRYIPVHTTPFRIGRQSNLSFTLPYPTVSGCHAEIFQTPAGLAIRDLGSTNGTYVNGQRVTGDVPLEQDDLVQFADMAFRVRRQNAMVETGTIQTNGYDRALALVQFDNLMRDRAVVPHFQPIIDLHSGETTGYEVLARSNVVGLETPHAMFTAAAMLNLEVDLSRMVRWEALQYSELFPEGVQFYLNTHPSELESPGLMESLRALRNYAPGRPLVLEIHESAITDAEKMRTLRAELTELDIKLAYDDFGAGQARLVELVEVRPDVLKFDMKLVQKIDKASDERRQMLATLVEMTRKLGVVALAEGIETKAEHDTHLKLGFDTGQGYYYGRPAPAHRYLAAPGAAGAPAEAADFAEVPAVTFST